MVNKLKNRGFTLIELLVVIAIIGILSSVVLASLNSARQKSRDARRVADIAQIKVALELYFDSNGEYPDVIADLAGTELPSEPLDPTSGASYEYLNLNSAGTAVCTAEGGNGCTNYHLAAILEDSGHTALGSDADADTGSLTGGIDGTSADCAVGTGTDQCYDVQP